MFTIDKVGVDLIYFTHKSLLKAKGVNGLYLLA
jgi:hypothetical protein